MNAADHIDRMIAELTDWRGETLAAVRESILAADQDIAEEWRYMGSPVWYRDGMVAVANAHKGKVKLTFAHGASLADPDKLFNAGLDGNARRAIDFLEGDKVDARDSRNSCALPSTSTARRQASRASAEMHDTRPVRQNVRYALYQRGSDVPGGAAGRS